MLAYWPIFREGNLVLLVQLCGYYYTQMHSITVWEKWGLFLYNVVGTSQLISYHLPYSSICLLCLWLHCSSIV